jgi:hypothetical protein
MVQLQRFNRRSAGSSQPSYELLVFSPLKMIRPTVLSWMKQWHTFPGLSVEAVRFIRFISVAISQAKARFSGSEEPPPASGTM